MKKYAWSLDEEHFFTSETDTIEGCLKEARRENAILSYIEYHSTVYIGETEYLSIEESISASSLLYEMEEYVRNEYDTEWDFGYFDNEIEDLNKQIIPIVEQWIKERGYAPDGVYRVVNVKEYPLEG